MKKLLFLSLVSLFIISCGMSREQKDDAIKQYTQQVIDDQAKLVAANDEMTRIKQFQVGRTQEERTKQIEAEEKVILQLSNEINDLNKKITNLQ
jgi:hypothetical protein